MTPVRPGISVLLEDAGHRLRGARVGLIVHPASVTPTLEASDDALRRAGFDVVSLFGPQHGARGEKQENMIESASFVDGRSGIPVHSLYGDVRKPTPEMLEGLDALVFDLQDVGVRVYTFVWTMTLAMAACREAGLRFVVLDRPNPLGGVVREGPLLRPGFESFVGLHPVPLRHGLTTGEMARLANDAFGIGCDLDVVPCQGWDRAAWFDETGLPYVLPSPNLPTLDSCVAYPGMVLLEGTNLSEGRGTTRPFEFVGAPFLDAEEFANVLEEQQLPGVTFRACHFEPTFHKHAGALCGGVQIHVTDRGAFRSVETAVAMLWTAKTLAPDTFGWLSPPYEYEAEKMPIDILWGSETLRTGIDRAATVADVMAGVGEDIARFDVVAEPYLLY